MCWQFKDNYGALGLLDALHGTDRKFKAHLAQLEADAAAAKAN